jgi:hypothetical protein
MNETERLEKLKFLLSKAEEKGLNPSETIGILQEKGVLSPERIIEIEKQVKDPKHAEYMKIWHENRKFIERIKAKEEREALRIKKALERKGFMCFFCKKYVMITNPESNTYSFKKNKNDIKKRIIIENKCPFCNNKLRSYGGLV